AGEIEAIQRAPWWLRARVALVIRQPGITVVNKSWRRVLRFLRLGPIPHQQKIHQRLAVLRRHRRGGRHRIPALGDDPYDLFLIEPVADTLQGRRDPYPLTFRPVARDAECPIDLFPPGHRLTRLAGDLIRAVNGDNPWHMAGAHIEAACGGINRRPRPLRTTMESIESGRPTFLEWLEPP